MKLERVLKMGANEVFVRAHQEVSKLLDRMTVTRPLARTGRTQPPATRIDPRHFFAGAADADTTARLLEKMPESRAQIISIADAIGQGCFDLLGYRGLDFGNPVDWHLDPLSGRHA